MHLAPVFGLDPEDLKRRLDEGDACVVLDVREDFEVATAPFPGALHIPLAQLGERLDALPRDRDVVVVCHHGIRSAWAARALAEAGFPRVLNLTGGIDAYARVADPSVPRY